MLPLAAHFLFHMFFNIAIFYLLAATFFTARVCLVEIIISTENFGINYFYMHIEMKL